jgi:signal transduction histidine kinase
LAKILRKLNIYFHSAYSTFPRLFLINMSGSYSPEFITLCRTQLILVANSLGADLGVIYIAQEVPAGQEPELEPLVFYPETTANQLLVNSQPWLEPLPSKSLPVVDYLRQHETEQIGQDRGAIPQRQSTQKYFQPLTAEGSILGLLMTTRLNRPWNKRERSQLEQVGHTITLALTIDRERQWAMQSLHEQQQWRSRQQILLNNLLHQLRNPLTAIYTFGKLLLKRLPSEDVNRRVASNILRESEHLKELLQQLDSSIEPAIETPALTGQASPLSLLPSSSLQLHPCAIPEILEPILANAAEIAQEKQLTFQTYIPPQLPLAMASSGALREVLGNLLDNALKYTPSGGIEVLVQPLPHQLSISISDTGLGISAVDLPNLFQRSYRGAQAQGQIPGTGLGLSIAKELVEQMGGTIDVVSPIEPDQKTLGTKFTIRLPLAAELS